jgi:hypothetical protein
VGEVIEKLAKGDDELRRIRGVGTGAIDELRDILGKRAWLHYAGDGATGGDSSLEDEEEEI